MRLIVRDCAVMAGFQASAGVTSPAQPRTGALTAWVGTLVAATVVIVEVMAAVAVVVTKDCQNQKPPGLASRAV